jgi:hypothetical protein
MKPLIYLIVWMLPLCMTAQKSSLDAFFDKYSGKEGYTSVHITQYMFDLLKTTESQKEEDEFKSVASKLKGIKVLTLDDDSQNVSADKFKSELVSILPKNVYKELMVVKDGAETIQFLMKESTGGDSEFVMLVTGPDDPVLLYMTGDIKVSDLSKLSKTMDVDGFEHLEKIDEKK